MFSFCSILLLMAFLRLSQHDLHQHGALRAARTKIVSSSALYLVQILDLHRSSPLCMYQK